MQRTLTLLLAALAASACSGRDGGSANSETTREAGVDSGVDARPADGQGAQDAAVNSENDAGADDAGPRRVPTIEGDLTCHEARVRIDELLAEARSENNECDADEDCIWVSADTECDTRCEFGVHRDRAQDFAAVLDTVSGFFDSPPTCPCGHSDVDCSTCAPGCFRGQCACAVSHPDTDGGSE